MRLRTNVVQANIMLQHDVDSLSFANQCSGIPHVAIPRRTRNQPFASIRASPF